MPFLLPTLFTPPTGGVYPPPPKNFLTPPTPFATGGVKSSYTYPDIVYAILNYTRLQQKNQITIAVFIKKHSFWILGRHPQESATDINYNGAHNYYFISHKSAC